MSESADYYDYHGDPIVCVIREKVRDVLIDRSTIPPIQQPFYYLKVSMVCFNPVGLPPEDVYDSNRPVYPCQLTEFEVPANSDYSQLGDYRNLNTGRKKAFDPRQLGEEQYAALIKAYGEKCVAKSHLKSSEVTGANRVILESCLELQRLGKKGLGERRQNPWIEKIRKAVSVDGGDPNLVIDDEEEYRVLHYARWVRGYNTVSFVRMLVENGADPTLGPIRRSDNGKVRMTPWYWYKTEEMMLPNGPLHQAVGGECGGLIDDNGQPVVQEEREESVNCDEVQRMANRGRVIVGVLCFIAMIIVVIVAGFRSGN